MLTGKDKQYIADTVTTVVDATLKSILPSNDGEVSKADATSSDVQYTDPYLKACEERKLELIKGGANIVLVKGRRGVTEINRTQQEINMINDEIDNRKNYRTHKRVG